MNNPFTIVRASLNSKYQDAHAMLAIGEAWFDAKNQLEPIEWSGDPREAVVRLLKPFADISPVFQNTFAVLFDVDPTR